MGIRGPCLPVQVAKALNMQPLFVSAFLSELKAEEKLKISNMKVGSSPLYYLPGQEPMLENFIQHLNPKEREAFNLIKKERVLDDDKQNPVIRVALRAIPDFASQVRVRIGEQLLLFWKYSLLSETEVKDLIKEKLSQQETIIPKQEEIPQPIQQFPQQVQQSVPPAIQKIEEPIPETIAPAIAKIKEETKELEEEMEKVEAPKEHKKEHKPKSPKKLKEEESELSKKVKHYLETNEIELLSVFLDKKHEFNAKVRLDTLFGKQELYLSAKDKKSITDTDLTMALQKAQSEKMQALILSPGSLNKKALPYFKEWSNLLKFDKIKL